MLIWEARPPALSTDSRGGQKISSTWIESNWREIWNMLNNRKWRSFFVDVHTRDIDRITEIIWLTRVAIADAIFHH